MLPFAVAAGSVPGRNHLMAGRNNQDAFLVRRSENSNRLVAVVCDGCTSGAESGVGAVLGSRIIVESLLRTESLPIESALETARQDAEAQFRILAHATGARLSVAVNELFLFTVVGFVVTSGRTWVFSIGDGAYAVNGELTQLGPFAGNEPPYLAYALVPSALKQDASHLLHFQINATLPTNELQSLLIGTDGTLDLVAAQDRAIPGTDERVGPLSQFWTDGRYFRNPDMVRRQLTRINRDVVRPDWRPHSLQRFRGLLPDDTTLVALRRNDGDA